MYTPVHKSPVGPHQSYGIGFENSGTTIVHLKRSAAQYSTGVAATFGATGREQEWCGRANGRFYLQLSGDSRRSKDRFLKTFRGGQFSHSNIGGS